MVLDCGPPDIGFLPNTAYPFSTRRRISAVRTC